MFDETNSSELLVEVLGYKLDESGYNDPLGDVMAVRALQLPVGQIFSGGITRVQMRGPTDDADNWDGNRLIRDLITGSETFGVPKCGVGSIVLLKGCSLDGDNTISIGGYSVVETCASADLEDRPDPGDVFEGGWIRPTREALVANSVLEYTTQLLGVLSPGM